jgi:hypothetical protein
MSPSDSVSRHLRSRKLSILDIPLRHACVHPGCEPGAPVMPQCGLVTRASCRASHTQGKSTIQPSPSAKIIINWWSHMLSYFTLSSCPSFTTIFRFTAVDQFLLSNVDSVDVTRTDNLANGYLPPFAYISHTFVKRHTIRIRPPRRPHRDRL